MIDLIEPLKVAVIENVAYGVQEVNEKLFGGFCDCGGRMLQKFWLNLEGMRILFSECEKCWKNHAYLFNSTKFLKREEVRLVGRGEILDYLKNFLTELELEALLSKAQSKIYKPQDLARAKKKLSDMNLPFEEIVSLLK
ncbi:MAG: hypothetical protein HA489_04970 [Archaeoglobales archaeon]|jgi:hypothetical protein|nr:hypothetical protein [Archaeoglobi archaeon]NHW23588.1 hypothetical protein [Archaeoglobales archaeon]